jgi:hypothetical protein
VNERDGRDLRGGTEASSYTAVPARVMTGSVIAGLSKVWERLTPP